MGAGRRAGTGQALTLAVALFAAITVLRFAAPDPASGVGYLYVVPISLLGVVYGIRGGLGGAALSLALTTWWAETHAVGLDAGGYAARGVAFVAVGAVVGWLVDRRREVEGEADRWFSLSDELCCVASFDGYFTRVNDAWTRWLGYGPEELLGRPYLDLVHPDDLERTVAEASALAAGEYATVHFENRYRAKDGTWHWLLWSSRSDRHRVYAAARDITERKALEARLHALAAEDTLTGLPNRRTWDARVGEEAHRAARADAPLAVVLIDLDEFKIVNDTGGHAAGDRLLVGCAAGWRTAMRECDVLARLGGDEFGVLLPDCDAAAAAAVVERMRHATPPGAAFSAGVATVAPGGGTATSIERADRALYDAKAGGGGRTVVAAEERPARPAGTAASGRTGGPR